MTDKDLIEACDILVKLEQEFAEEEAKLSEVSNEHAIKIDELDQQITTFRRNEDVDFRVFSPRNISTGNTEKIKVLENEKKMLEREKRDADKQLHYYFSPAKFRSASSQKRRMILISFGSYGRRLGRNRSCCHLVKSS